MPVDSWDRVDVDDVHMWSTQQEGGGVEAGIISRSSDPETELGGNLGNGATGHWNSTLQADTQFMAGSLY